MAEGGKVKNTEHKPSVQQKARAEYIRPEMRVKEDKHATDAGLTPAQKKAVLTTESKIRNRKTETIRIVDDNGNVINPTISGTRSKAKAMASLIPQNGVFTHNHPGAEDEPIYIRGRKVGVRGGGTGIGARIGASLSGPDLKSAIKTNAKEIRAVTPTYTFSIRRPAAGWGNINADDVHRDWNREFNNYVNNHKEYAKESRQNLGRINAMASHVATRAIAKKYGMTYTRRKAQ